jgi:hypothetical protein
MSRTTFVVVNSTFGWITHIPANHCRMPSLPSMRGWLGGMNTASLA